MQGKYDNRRSYDQLRDEYKGKDYYDLITRDAVKWFKPYYRRLLYVGYGNHETAVVKNTNTDILQRWVYKIKEISDSPLSIGGYASWLRVVVGREQKGVKRTWAKGINIKVAHNAGGGNAPVTRGLIQTNRQAVYLQNADIVLNGDNHEGYAVPIARETLLDCGKSVQSVVWYLRTPGYKRAYGKERFGFDTEKVAAPKPIGCCLVTIRLFSNHDNGRDIEIVPQPIIE
jgi:hypothetical protein